MRKATAEADLTVEQLKAIESKRRIDPYRVCDITIDPRVQRALDPNRVNAIVSDFVAEALGILTVSLRADGTLVCLDGQHRAEALKRLGLDRVEWPMATYEGLSLAEEAALFRLLNNTKKLDAAKLFSVAVIEGRPEYVEANKIIKKYDFVADPGKANGAVAVQTIVSMYLRDNGTTLDRTFYVVRNVWGARKAAANQTLLRGIGLVLGQYREAVDLSRMVQKLKMDGRSADPEAFVGQARASAKITSETPANSMAGLVVAIYNHKLPRRNQFPAWGTKIGPDED